MELVAHKDSQHVRKGARSCVECMLPPLHTCTDQQLRVADCSQAGNGRSSVSGRPKMRKCAATAWSGGEHAFRRNQPPETHLRVGSPREAALRSSKAVSLNSGHLYVDWRRLYQYKVAALVQSCTEPATTSAMLLLTMTPHRNRTRLISPLRTLPRIFDNSSRMGLLTLLSLKR